MLLIFFSGIFYQGLGKTGSLWETGDKLFFQKGNSFAGVFFFFVTAVNFNLCSIIWVACFIWSKESLIGVSAARSNLFSVEKKKTSLVYIWTCLHDEICNNFLYKAKFSIIILPVWIISTACEISKLSFLLWDTCLLHYAKREYLNSSFQNYMNTKLHSLNFSPKS